MGGSDNFIDDEDDTCPLCIEEFDLSDLSFKPCPCGYQVCQFCFNNIKTNMNGLCPACRRPYDERTIEWKVVTSEEVAEFKANIQKNQKKRANDQRLKEAQQRQAERNDRKNLVGVRVVQKNLVYVTGLTPTVREDELMKTLRKAEFFGQYGTIQKISISNRKGSDGHNQSLGIYVTFEKKEDAARCIHAVNGSQNGDRILRAQLGTTKYCSAWLRHEQCTNRQCMFLHEQGDEEDSYTRQDLSSMNSIDSQRKQAIAGGSRSASRQQGNAVQAAQMSQPMVRSTSKDGSENGDGSALPVSANWARNPQRSRRGSHATSGAADSPAISSSLPVTAESALETVEATPQKESAPQKKSGLTPRAAPAKPSPRAKQPGMDPMVVELLRSCSNIQLKMFTDEEMAQFPPLFDVNGGAKRRAMREAEKTQCDPEEPADVQEASDGELELEAGGSLALGGEPEDRDPVRDFESRRAPPGAPPPIQKSVGEGIFGPSLGNFIPGSSTVGSIGNRTTAAHQQLYSSIRPGGASAFDNAPPGISTQAPLFQQGHQRGSSRYNFANDGAASANSVKVAANPRVMAQQASMMPQQLHSQQHSSQYYGTSMSGPPPGLKSSGTPPNSFHSFSSGSGLANKDSDMMHMMRRAGGAGGNAHEKREFVSSPFSNQYPPSTSSTPAPASGLLASLYGTPPPGQFQDFGHKQKKKGKKHRHVNTSSSGGSGLVDLADPSILQARMQHQQQSNAGVGQGPFGGQSQVDDELPSLDEATSSVDALVADDSEPLLKNLPPLSIATRSPASIIPPGLSPRAPPGLTSLAAFRSPVVPRIPATVSPAVATQSAALPTEAKVISTRRPDITTLHSGKTVSKVGKGKAILNEEEFPALDSVKPSLGSNIRLSTPVVAPKQPLPVAITSKRIATLEPPVQTQAPIQQSQSKIEKRPKPGVLNISTTTKGANPKILDLSVTTDKTSDQVPVPSSTTRATPKTLKIVSTTKAEAPPPLPTMSGGPPAPTMRSVATSSQRPETPASDLISDTASVVSWTVSTSRPGSPPPSRIGSAPVRTTTKSTKRKQRKDNQKDFVDQVAAAPKIGVEEIAPIIGRKKKQNKQQKTAKMSAASATSTSGPETPSNSQTPKNEQTLGFEETPALGTPGGSRWTTQKTQANNSRGAAQPDFKSKSNDHVPKKQAYTEKPIALDDGGLKRGEKPQPSPAGIFNALVSDSMLPEADRISMLKPFPATNWRHEPLAYNDLLSSKPTYHKSVISDEDQEVLLAGNTVRKVVDGLRIMLTPNGDCVRNLSQEEEDRYLELQQRVAESNSTPAAFMATRHEPSAGFTLIKGRAVPNGPPGYFPPAPGAYPSDPVNKIQRDEAIGYINQYVLPRLGLGSPPSGGPAIGLSDMNADAATLGKFLLGGHHAPPPLPPPPPPAPLNNISGLAAHGSRAEDEERTRRVSGASSTGATAGSSSSLHQSSAGSGLLPGPVAPLMSLEDAEAAMMLARKETEKLEKSLNQVIRRNRRLLIGSAH